MAENGEENGSREGQDLAKDEKIAQYIVEEIERARFEGRENVVLLNGAAFIPIAIINDKAGKKKIEFGGNVIAEVEKGQAVPTDTVVREMQKYKRCFDFEIATILDREPTAKEMSHERSLKLEAELKKAKEEGRAHALRMDREITDGESGSLMFHRMFGERMHEVYRVKDPDDPHKYKYIGIDEKGEYSEPNGSTGNEGTNPTQLCWIQNEDGSFEKKTVDDIRLFGRYAIATDVPENAASEHTRTLVGTRTPSGEYIFMPMLDERIKDTLGNDTFKDNMTRANSILEQENVILAANLARTIIGTKLDGKLTVEEVEFIRKLQKEGLEDDQIRKVVDIVLIVGELDENGLKDLSITVLLNSLETVKEQLEQLKSQDYREKDIKEILGNVNKKKMSFEDAKKQVDERNAETAEGIRTVTGRTSRGDDDGEDYGGRTHEHVMGPRYGY